MKNKKKMQKGLKRYYALRRAYVARHGEAPPKGTTKADLESMGFKPVKKSSGSKSTKKKRKKRKKRRSRGGSRGKSGAVFDWKQAFWQ